MRSIGVALSSLNLVSDKSRQLSTVINHTATLAESVSAKVRRLDEARVGDVVSGPGVLGNIPLTICTIS